MLLWDTDCVSVVLPPSQGALIPDRRDGVGYWPMSTAVATGPVTTWCWSRRNE